MYHRLLKRLTAHNQQHILRFWDDLDDSQRAEFAAQIDRIDLTRLAQLARGVPAEQNWADLARRADPPPAIRHATAHASSGSPVGTDTSAALARGESALAAGEVGVLVVAGGQGTRLGFPQPKSLYPIGPVSNASLLQIHIEKILAIAARYSVRIPLYLMTSPATHEPTVAFLERNDRFGLPPEDCIVFCQGTMPAVDLSTGHLLLSEPGALFLSPNGHGGMVEAIQTSGALDDAQRRGIQWLFYLQIDNPLVPICDAEFLGHHLLAESEMSSLAIRKNGPDDKVGNFVVLDGRMHVIEYSDFPDDVAQAREPDGSLRFWAGSIAIHIFATQFLDRVANRTDGLPFHIARKKVPHIDLDGNRVDPSEPNALKFERFIFDLLPDARNAIVVEAAAEDVFAPLKNAPGAEQDTPEYVQSFLLAQHHRWLRAAGATVVEGAEIEIRPLFAPDARGVRERVVPGTRYEGRQVLQ